MLLTPQCVQASINGSVDPVIVSDISMDSRLTLCISEAGFSDGINFPYTVDFAQCPSGLDLSCVPLEISMNGEPAQRTDVNSGVAPAYYEYYFSSGAWAILSYIDDQPVFCIMDDTGGLAEGRHDFLMTIPADNMQDGQARTAEFMIEVVPVDTVIHTIQAAASPQEGGKVLGSGSYAYGSEAVIEAVPNSGYVFSHWVENGTELPDTSSQLTITAEASRSLTAVFMAEAQRPVVPSDTTAPVLTAVKAKRNGTKSAAVTFISDEAGRYYYTLTDSGVSVNEVCTEGEGDECVAGENVLRLNDLTSASSDVHIVAKDGAGNMGSIIVINIEEYKNPSPPASEEDGNGRDDDNDDKEKDDEGGGSGKDPGEGGPSDGTGSDGESGLNDPAGAPPPSENENGGNRVSVTARLNDAAPNIPVYEAGAADGLEVPKTGGSPTALLETTALAAVAGGCVNRRRSGIEIDADAGI